MKVVPLGMNTKQQPTPIENGITHTIMGSQLCEVARGRGDTVVEISQWSPDSTSTVVIDVRSATKIWAEPNQPYSGSGWTSIVLQPSPGQWMNLVINDVDVLIEALQKAKFIYRDSL